MNAPIPKAPAAVSLSGRKIKPRINRTTNDAIPTLAFLIPLFISSDKMFPNDIKSQERQAGRGTEIAADHRLLLRL